MSKIEIKEGWMRVPAALMSLKPEAIPKKNAQGDSSEEKRTDEARRIYEVAKLSQGKGFTGKKLRKMKLLRVGGGIAPALPPTVELFPRNFVTLVFRVGTAVSAGAVSGQVTVGDVLGAIGVVGRVTNTSATALATAFRLKECRLYAANSGTGVSDAEIIWFSGNTDHDADESKVRTAQAWQTFPNALVSRPPKGSISSLWTRGSVADLTSIVLLLTATVGSVVHLDLDWDLPTGVLTNSVITLSTVAIGVFYRLALNRTNGSSTIIPADYVTTT